MVGFPDDQRGDRADSPGDLCSGKANLEAGHVGGVQIRERGEASEKDNLRRTGVGGFKGVKDGAFGFGEDPKESQIPEEGED